MKALIDIQSELKAPKNQFNSFGKYKYRNCEDILEAAKPILLKHGCVLTITDQIKDILGIIFVESTARITNGKETIEVTAQAGIDPNRKGMDIAQCFGASSSYARKYALNGLFLIDDTKDSDATNTVTAKSNITVESSSDLIDIQKNLKNCHNSDDLKLLYDSLEPNEQVSYKALFTKRRLEIDKK